MSLTTPEGNTTINKLKVKDQAVHAWYRFVLGYPPHLVRQYLDKLGVGPDDGWILDPFCGTGTTPVEARLNGYRTFSTDGNPICVLATRVKLAWGIELEKAERLLGEILGLSSACLLVHGLDPGPRAQTQLEFFGAEVVDPSDRDWRRARGFCPDALVSPQSAGLIPKGFISPKPLLRVLAVRFAIETLVGERALREFLLLALATVIVATAGNVGFGPEVYRRKPKEDADVLRAFGAMVAQMIADLADLKSGRQGPFPQACVFRDDARQLSSLEGKGPVGAVITSPPYPNEKDYTRSTRLESVLLGLLRTKPGLRGLKEGLLRSNTRNVFKADDDDRYVADLPSVTRLAQTIEDKRIQLGKTSGFERQYHRVTALYFGGMFRHLRSLYPRIRPGAQCAYVVGDQMSFFRVHIKTAHVLADVALKAGYQVEGIELWRTRAATATGADLEENVLILRRPEEG
ncbi:MAG: hypothetical protein ACLF0G_11345 [Candidatus Brocadiia bacterium]